MQLKIRDLIRSITKNSYHYEEKYMKIKFNLDDELPLNRTIEILSMMIIISGTFFESNKYYPERLKDSNKQI